MSLRIKPHLPRAREEEIREQGYDGKAFQTYLWVSKDTYYRVSTCYRESSCAYSSWFYETFIFKGSTEGNPNEEWVGDETGSDHFKVARRIIELGEYKKEED